MTSEQSFVYRHIGPRPEDINEMLEYLCLSSLEELVDRTIPPNIRLQRELDPLKVGAGCSEFQILQEMRALASQNKVFRSYIGMGYSNTITPPVIQRAFFEDPRWYTPYTPYQSEISQGRLEALLNFQTMIMELTGMEIANASLLDEGTAAAEAMSMCLALKGGDGKAFFVAEDCHPQTIAIVRSRAEPLGIEVLVGSHESLKFDRPLFGALAQYPATDGVIHDLQPFVDRVHAAGALVVVAADILSLALLKPPGEFDVDIVVGSAQRFGVPPGFGGPHAAFMAARDAYKRHIPGRIVGVSRDADGNPGVRLALQTREQHIRREKATSNICTAQALLANMASMYAVYHGPEGLRAIAEAIHRNTALLQRGLEKLGYEAGKQPFFDTLSVPVGQERAAQIMERARDHGINLRALDAATVAVSLDETVGPPDLLDLLEVFHDGSGLPFTLESLAGAEKPVYPAGLARTTPVLSHPVFQRYHSETEMLRYLNQLANKDLSLANGMIPLGSCTMKLNAAAEMMPVSWPEFSQLHPFAPLDQAKGYLELIHRLEGMLEEITGFDAISLQPNAGSQGEFSGLLVIHHYHRDRGQEQRHICLIPDSAHGTNPATATMAGMKIVLVGCDSEGNINVDDLRRKAVEHRDNLAALMVTYPSTHGVFEEAITEICDIVHVNGGQVYMDGANMNAQVGLCRPGDMGADVCHLNLHKTFCIPHGGGGPGIGPIGVKSHLAPYLPGHPVVPMGGSEAIGAVSAAPWGSASILPIPYAYIILMGAAGLKLATQVALLSANYVARRLQDHFPVLYRGKNGFVAHECIVDVSSRRRLAFKAATGIEVEDVAKRLIDYGFHAPTVSFPEPGALMIEPTESESKEELDRFCDAMIRIRAEITEIEKGEADPKNNVLKNSPHTAQRLTSDTWNYPYSRQQAAYPAPWLKEKKYWSPVARIDNVYGERNLVCSCPPIESYD